MSSDISPTIIILQFVICKNSTHSTVLCQRKFEIEGGVQEKNNWNIFATKIKEGEGDWKKLEREIIRGEFFGWFTSKHNGKVPATHP
jgi:hypothetical protein